MPTMFEKIKQFCLSRESCDLHGDCPFLGSDGHCVFYRKPEDFEPMEILAAVKRFTEQEETF